MVSVCAGVYSVVALLPKFTSEESAQRNPWTIGHGFQQNLILIKKMSIGKGLSNFSFIHSYFQCGVLVFIWQIMMPCKSTCQGGTDWHKFQLHSTFQQGINRPQTMTSISVKTPDYM